MLFVLALLTITAPADRATVIDHGVLRWQDDRSEVALFGVNYYPPFSIDFAQLQLLGADHKQVIDQDLAHLQRLGLTCLRLHCFDREISDKQGNLLDNEHLALLDYLVAQAKARGLYTVLTPIAWWGTPGDSPGFSTFFTMPQMTGDAGEPRAAQRRYLAQFVQHRNRYTKLTYANDPAVLAFEMINEPIYPPGTSDEQIVTYINALAEAVRATGCRKPLFYSYFMRRLAAVGHSNIDGITFGWYPTGLVAGRTLTQDYLGRVDDYADMREPVLADKVKAVYEFDAADVESPYLYPAMARAFRSGGAQWACQFQYDAWPLARSNVNWMTHFLSLPCTPGKAVSFMIAAEAFRRVPRGFAAGKHPAGDRFGDFRVSYEQGLSELIDSQNYWHSNTTTSPAKDPAALAHVYGVGNCPLVEYDGNGAVFLDKLAPGQWRLEVYPDVITTADPHGHTGLGREVSRVRWAPRDLTVHLPDLGEQFTAMPLDEGNMFVPPTDGARLTVRPGVYRLTRAGLPPLRVAEVSYFAPPEEPGRPEVLAHEPVMTALSGEELPLRATCTAEGAAVAVWYRSGEGAWQQRPLARVGRYGYQGAVPAAAVQAGRLEYALTMTAGGRSTTFPGGLAGRPAELGRLQPLRLWSAGELKVAPEAKLSATPGETASATLTDGALRVAASAFSHIDGSCVSCAVPMAGQAADGRTAIRLRLRAGEADTSEVELILTLTDGRQFDTVQRIGPRWRDVTVPLGGWHARGKTPPGVVDPAAIRELRLCFGTWLFGAAATRPHAVELAEVSLAPPDSSWVVDVAPVGPPVPLLVADEAAQQRIWHKGGRLRLVSGPGGDDALELSCPSFGPPPDSLGVTCPISLLSPARRAAMAACGKLRLKLRGLTPAATQMEVVLTESDGSSWGTEVPLTGDWATIEVPLSKLRYFGHWHKVEGRGGAGDRLRAGEVTSWHLTIGPWLNKELGQGAWRVQVAEITLVP